MERGVVTSFITCRRMTAVYGILGILNLKSKGNAKRQLSILLSILQTLYFPSLLLWQLIRDEEKSSQLPQQQEGSK